MHRDSLKVQLEQYHKDLFGWALHCCYHDREMAYDVVQSSYLKILEREVSFGGKSTFKTWAFVIIRNTALDAFKKRKKEIMLFQTNEAFFPETGYDAEIENKLDLKIAKPFFLEAINQLSERQKQIIHLVFYHDLSLNEAAKVLQLSSGSVRKFYDRAKKSLSEWFQKRGVTEIN